MRLTRELLRVRTEMYKQRRNAEYRKIYIDRPAGGRYLLSAVHAVNKRYTCT